MIMCLTATRSPEVSVANCFRVSPRPPARRPQPDAAGPTHHWDRLVAGLSRWEIIDESLMHPRSCLLAFAPMRVRPRQFGSPVPSRQLIQARRAPRQTRFGKPPGFDLHEGCPESALAHLHPTIPFRDEAEPELCCRHLYCCFPARNALTRHCMLRHLNPRRMIGVGYGNSTRCTAPSTPSIACVTARRNRHQSDRIQTFSVYSFGWRPRSRLVPRIQIAGHVDGQVRTPGRS
jgi:hypothetical protein